MTCKYCNGKIEGNKCKACRMPIDVKEKESEK